MSLPAGILPGSVAATKKYPVAEIFKSIQGEGHFVGYPMVFVRLGGCSVTDCAIRAECDTDYRTRWALTPADIVNECRALGGFDSIVSITGGEPSDHDLIPLVDALKQWHYRVHLETSGKRLLEGVAVDWLTVSPKTTRYEQRTGHVLKIVVRPEWTWAEVRELNQGGNFFHRYLQPLTGADGKPINLDQVVDMVRSPENVNSQWALSTQAHRIWGLS